MQQRLESREWERERERKIGICFQLKGQDIGVGTQEQQMLKKDKKLKMGEASTILRGPVGGRS